MIASPTPAQKQAIETTGHNLIVSAAAGSGKTAVMVDRAVRMVLQGQELSRMLMVTFTNAAAAQMKQRIARELSQAAQQPDLPNRSHVRRQLTLVQSADISTVNAFCLTLVRRYFHLVDVDPLFAIADQSQQTLLEAEALDQTLDACFESHDMAFLQMLTHLCSGQEDRLRDAVLQIHHFARSSDDPQAWMQRAFQIYQGGKEAEQAFDDYVALEMGIRDRKIYYTTDGTDPRTSATREEYTAPIEIKDRSNDPNVCLLYTSHRLFHREGNRRHDR